MGVSPCLAWSWWACRKGPYMRNGWPNGRWWIVGDSLSLLCSEPGGSSGGSQDQFSSLGKREGRGSRIWTFTLFGLHLSYLFAWSDMFLSTWGAVQCGKVIRLKYLCVLHAKQPNREMLRGKRDIFHLFQEDVPLSPVPVCTVYWVPGGREGMSSIFLWNLDTDQWWDEWIR